MQTCRLIRFYRSCTCEAPRLCRRRGAAIHDEQPLINTGEEKMLCKQGFLSFTLRWSSVGMPAAVDKMKIDFLTGSAVYLIPTYCTEEEDEEEERKK